MSIDAAVAAKLAEVLGHERVYPDARWLTTDDDGRPERLDDPVVMYRQTGGSGEESLDCGRSALRSDFFLLEVFADRREDCSEVRDELLDAFDGPLSDSWEQWDAGDSTTVSVHWAQADDPEAGAELPDEELHRMFAFVRLVLEIQWHKE